MVFSMIFVGGELSDSTRIKLAATTNMTSIIIWLAVLSYTSFPLLWSSKIYLFVGTQNKYPLTLT